MRGFGFLGFVGLTALCWGIYGPVLHKGQGLLGTHDSPSTLRSLICVGIAYFLIAVVVPLILLSRKKEQGGWSIGGFVWSFAAGAIGAVGALGIILAFKFNGSPIFVMPLVFGCAPVMNTIVTMLMNRTVRNASFVFYLGIAIVAIGAVGVLTFKPRAAAPAAHGEKVGAQASMTTSPATEPHMTSHSGKIAAAPPALTSVARLTGGALEVNGPEQDPEPETSAAGSYIKEDSANSSQEKSDSSASAAQSTDTAHSSTADEKGTSSGGAKSPKGPNVWNLMCVLLTAVCWGAYGPVLHLGQSKMNGSRLRPFLCVGLAYFAIAVVIPYFLLIQFPEVGSWNSWGGIFWSLMGGAAGAVGALGIIYAFNFGGKPLFVMPLVFGGAPVINTFYETLTQQLFNQLSPMFFASLGLVIFGAVTVLISAPRGGGSHTPRPLAAGVLASNPAAPGADAQEGQRRKKNPFPRRER